MKPLHSIEAESALLGWMFLNTGAKLKWVCETIRPEMFYLSQNRMLYTVMRESGKYGHCDAVKVKADLISRSILDDVGGEEKLVTVATQAAVAPDVAMQVIIENWSLRELQFISARIGNIIEDDDSDTADKIAQARSLLRNAVFQTGGRVPDINEINIDGDDETGILTGIARLDNTTGYGLPKGQTAAFCAYHKGGKTSELIRLALYAMGKGHHIVYATLADLDSRQLKRRMLKQLCGWSKAPYSTEEYVLWKDSVDWLNDQLKDGSCRVYESATHSRYVEDLSAKMLEINGDCKIDLLVLDYIQKARSRERGARDGKTAELEYVSDALKSLAEELACPVAFGSQITLGDGKKEQTAKYARGIEEDAGMVIHIGQMDETTKVAQYKVAFNRFGPSGVTWDMVWNPYRVRYEEVQGG